ncbi:MAG: hypothetical protein ACUVTU_03535 [Desulfurispora sp.]|uniref:hypothetical protein n=1 Tax=Desulfurispora sp. TaxID=3014275 RepID=UPI00404A7659
MKLLVLVLAGLLVGLALAWIYHAVLRRAKQPSGESNTSSNLPVQEQQIIAETAATPLPRPKTTAAGTAAPPGTTPLPARPGLVPDEHLREAGLVSVLMDTPQGKQDAAEGFRLEGRREIRLEIVLQQEKK